MAIIESGNSSIGEPRIQFSSQPLSYQSLQGDHYQKVRQLVTTRFQQAEQYARSKFERFYRWEKLIHMVSKKKAYDWKANAFLPYALSMSEQSAAIKWMALFLTRPYVTVQPRVAGLDEIAFRRQALLDWHFTGDVDVIDLSLHMLRQSERYGKAIAVVAPEWDTSVMRYRHRMELPTALGPIARMAWKMQEKRNYRINAYHIDLTDFFGEPNRRRINGKGGMNWLCRRYYLTQQELLALEQGQLIGPSVNGQPVSETRDTQQQDLDEYKLRRLFLDKYDDVDMYRDQFDRAVELIEYQGSVPRELVDPQTAEMEDRAGRDPYQRLIILANRNVVLEDVAFPWDHALKSYIEMDCVPDPYDFWGKGKIEPIEHGCYVGNEIMNMRIDNVKQAINAMIGVHFDRCPPGTKRRLMSQPFGVMETYGPPQDIIQRIPFGDVTQSSYAEQQQIYGLLQEADAVNETLLGTTGKSHTTLGEHALKAEAASTRLKFELVGQAKQLLGWPYGLSRFIISLDRQYLPLPTYLRVAAPTTPDDFMQLAVSPKDLAEEDELFAYLPSGSTENFNVSAKRNDLIALTQALQPYLPIAMAAGMNLPQFIRTIFKTFGFDPGQFFPKAAGIMAPGEGGLPMNPLPMLGPQAGERRSSSAGASQPGNSVVLSPLEQAIRGMQRGVPG